MMQNNRAKISFIALLSAFLLVLTACNTQEKPKDPVDDTPTNEQQQPKENASPLPDPKGPLTEEEYETLVQAYYDELMAMSNEASHKLDDAMASSQQEEKPEVQQNKLKIAMGTMQKLQPLYNRFAGIAAPESYSEAQALIDNGAEASGHVIRVTVEMSEVAAGENGAAEALVLQKELESYTTDAMDFSKGLKMVLGDSVGTGEGQ